MSLTEECTETIQLDYKYEIKKEELADPARILSITIHLPNGVSAKFIRSGGWKKSEVLSEEAVARNLVKLGERGITLSAFTVTERQSSDYSPCPLL